VHALSSRASQTFRIKRRANPHTTQTAVKENPALAEAPPLPALKTMFIDLAYALVPMGLAAWIAFSISFVMVNISYAIPLLSDPFGWGWNLFGTAKYDWRPYFPELLPYIQIPILLIGLALSIITAYQIVRPYAAERSVVLKSVAPVALFLFGITTVFFVLYL
jgi:hypothetical protein